MRGKVITLLIFIGILFFLMIFASSCGVNYHLRRAAHHQEKAIDKGAKISIDTTWKQIKFKAPEMHFQTKLNGLCLTSTPIEVSRPDGKKAIIRTDTVTRTVYVECPEQEVEAKVPVTVNTQIKSPPGFWYYAGWGCGIAVVFFIAGYFLSRTRIYRWLSPMTDHLPISY